MDPRRPVLADGLPRETLRRLRERYPATDAPPAPWWETPEDAAERRAARCAAWTRSIPPDFAWASVTALTRDQDPAGKVARWWESGSRTLVLRSDAPGLGKTYAAYAIGNQAVEAGVWTAAWTMPDLNTAMRPGGDDGVEERVRLVDLLILDDLGAEEVSGWTLERLGGLLDARNRHHRRTVITTNITWETLLERYGSRIADRVREGLTAVTMTGKSWRKPAPW